MPQRHHTTAGFTLIEMAIVVALFGLLVSGGLLGVGQFFDQLKTRDTTDRLGQVERALSTYVIQNGELPCADVTFDGIENRNGTTCQQPSPLSNATAEIVQGTIPYLTLGLTREQASDGWHNLFTYLVTVRLAENNALNCSSGSLNYLGLVDGLQRAASGEIEPLDDPTTSNWPPPSPPRSAYALISHGENGFGAVGQSGGQRTTTGASDHEALNYVAGGSAQRNGPLEIATTLATGDANGVFDDLVRVRTPAQILYDIGCNHDPS